MRTFLEQNFETLNLYTNALAKAHGKNHPEVFEVRKLYLAMQQKMNEGNWRMDDELEQIEQVTHHYTIPNDACETMTKTYQMFQKMSQLR